MSKKKQKILNTPTAIISPQKTAPSPNFNWQPIAIFLVAFGIYANSLTNGFAGDDIYFLTQNKFVQNGQFGNIFSYGSLYGFSGEHGEQPYRPIALSILAIEKIFFGNSATEFHLVHILLFALSCVLLFKLLKKLLPHKYTWLPLIATMLFTVHPIHSEVVDNIKSMDELLGFLFALGSIFYFTKYLDGTASKSLALSVILFFCGLLSKESDITFLAIFPLVAYFFYNLSIKNAGFKSLIFVFPVMVFLIIRSRVIIPIVGISTKSNLDIVINHAKGFEQLIGTKFLILWYFIKMLVWPFPLSFDYSYSQIGVASILNLLPILSFLFYTVLIVLSAKYFKSRSVLSFCILYFLITMSVTNNFFMVGGSSFGERFLYAPSLAFCLALPYLATKMSLIYQKIVFALVALVFICITINRNPDWASNRTLYESALKTAPLSNRNHLNVGLMLLEDAEKTQDTTERKILLNRSMNAFKTSISLLPTENNYFGLGKCLALLKPSDSTANRYFRESIKIRPNMSNSYSFLGQYYFKKRDFGQAKNYFKIVTDITPTSSEAYNNLGAVYAQEGNRAEALKTLNKALELDPSNENVKANLAAINGTSNVATSASSAVFDQAYALFQQKKIAEAKQKALEMLSLDPKYANNLELLGLICDAENNENEAIGYYQRAINAEHANPAKVYFNMGNAYLKMKNNSLALANYENAIKANPSYPNAYANAAAVYQMQGNAAKGKAYLKRYNELK